MIVVLRRKLVVLLQLAGIALALAGPAAVALWAKQHSPDSAVVEDAEEMIEFLE